MKRSVYLRASANQLMLVLAFLLFSCEQPETTLLLQSITTTEISSITDSTALSGGIITADVGYEILSRGVCWNTETSPTIDYFSTTEVTGNNEFVCELSNLLYNTNYYVRAYITNSSGTYYGNEVDFKTTSIYSGTVTDFDNNIYHYITIGNQQWLLENLKTTHYNNGDLIGTTDPINKDISQEVTPKYQWAYAGDEGNVAIYGRLYTFDVIEDSRGIAPVGWRVASDEDWTYLASYLGGESVAGGKLKDVEFTHWLTPNTGASNVSGFTAIPGGARRLSGEFYGMGKYGYWWTSTRERSDYGWYTYLRYDTENIERGYSGKIYGNSIRCVRDLIE